MFIIREAWGLEGNIPESLYDCPLSGLKINCTNLEGPLSPNIGKLKNTLTNFELANSINFKSELPKELGECKRLQYLVIVDTGFYGKAPIEINQLDSIFPGSFTLWENHFTEVDWGLLTQEKGWMPQLSFNDFSGEVPDGVLSSEVWQDRKGFLYPFNKGYGFSNVTEY